MSDLETPRQHHHHPPRRLAPARDGATLASVLPHSARQFGRAIVMPNLKPPVTTTAAAEAYRERILAALPEGMSFEPLMTLYLTNNTRRTKSAARRRAASCTP
jgi:dihydroorotase